MTDQMTDSLKEKANQIVYYWDKPAAQVYDLLWPEIESLRHDLERQITIANAFCNENEQLRAAIRRVVEKHYCEVVERGKGPCDVCEIVAETLK